MGVHNQRAPPTGADTAPHTGRIDRPAPGMHSMLPSPGEPSVSMHPREVQVPTGVNEDTFTYMHAGTNVRAYQRGKMGGARKEKRKLRSYKSICETFSEALTWGQGCRSRAGSNHRQNRQ